MDVIVKKVTDLGTKMGKYTEDFLVEQVEASGPRKHQRSGGKE